MVECLVVNLAQPIHFCVCICGRLEVGQEMVDVIAPFQPADSFVELRSDGAAPYAPAGAEAAVIAKHTSADSDRAIYIWAGKARIETDLLHAMAESFAQIIVLGEIAPSCGTPIGQSGGPS